MLTAGAGDRKAGDGSAGVASPADRLAVLAGIPLFEPLNKRHLRRVARLGETASYEAGETLARAGVRGEAFYVILDGAARVETPDGHEHPLGPATSSASSRCSTARRGRRRSPRPRRSRPCA